ncbi:MAG: hypothetical protein ACK515_16995 [bacterium]
MSGIQSGQILFTLLSGVVVSLAVTAVFLLLYRRAVARTMRTESLAGGIDHRSPRAPGWTPGDQPVPFQASSQPSPPAQGATPLAQRARAVRRRIAIAYTVAFGLSAAILHAPPMHEAWAKSTDGLGMLRAFVWWFPVWSATLFIVAALLHLGRRQTWFAVAIAMATGAGLSILVPTAIRLVTGTALSPALLANAFYFAIALAMNAALPAVLVWATGRPRLRNVMPLVLLVVMSLSLVVAAVYHVFVQLFAGSGPVQETALLAAAMAVGPAGLVLLLALPAGWLAWRGTAALTARYRARRFSDMQLLADAWWGVIAAFGVAALWQYGGWLALGCATGAWACYFVSVRLLLRIQRTGSAAGGPSLLLLRVFGHQARTERLFDAVAAHWRFTGPVAMIAGADLAVRSIDVDEALAFAHGEIEASYVADEAGLERRLAGLRAQADPDGRYRVEEFFCFDDTWRATLQWLLLHTRVVLMDLRGFDSRNAGCVFELEQLGRLGSLHRCVFVADAQTDRALAERTLSGGARSGGAVSTRWIDMPRDDEAGMARLRDALFEAAASTLPERPVG